MVVLEALIYSLLPSQLAKIIPSFSCSRLLRSLSDMELGLFARLVSKRMCSSLSGQQHIRSYILDTLKRPVCLIGGRPSYMHMVCQHWSHPELWPDSSPSSGRPQRQSRDNVEHFIDRISFGLWWSCRCIAYIYQSVLQSVARSLRLAALEWC